LSLKNINHINNLVVFFNFGPGHHFIVFNSFLQSISHPKLPIFQHLQCLPVYCRLLSSRGTWCYIRCYTDSITTK